MQSRRWFISTLLKWSWLALFAFSILAVTAESRAQTDKAAAEVLFREGMRLIKEGKFAEACPKLEESQRQEASLGTQFYLADCYEHLGRTASAWANFVEVADKARMAKENAKDQAARARANAIESKLARLTIDVEDRTLPGLSVRRNDAALGQGQWGVAVPVDPGSYRLQATAPGYKDWSKSIEIGPGSNVIERIPRLEPLPREVAPAPAPPAVTPQHSAPLAPSADTGSSSNQGTIGLVVAGAGVVALGAAGVLALLASNANEDSEQGCDADNRCQRDALEDRDRAVTFADTATVLSIAGGVLAITGGTLWLTAPSGSREAHASTQVGVGPGSLFVRGRF